MFFLRYEQKDQNIICCMGDLMHELEIKDDDE